MGCCIEYRYTAIRQLNSFVRDPAPKRSSGCIVRSEKVLDDALDQLTLLKEELQRQQLYEQHEKNFKKWKIKQKSAEELDRLNLLKQKRQQQQEQQKWVAHNEEVRKLAVQFKNTKQEQFKSTRRRQELQAHKKAQERRLQIAANMQTVAQRQQRFLDRLEAQKQEARERTEREEVRRQHLVDKLLQAVQVTAARDPERLLQPTQSFLQERVEPGSAFKAVQGYTEQRLFQDKRFKLLFSLAERGLLHTQAASVAIAGDVSRPVGWKYLQQ